MNIGRRIGAVFIIAAGVVGMIATSGMALWVGKLTFDLMREGNYIAATFPAILFAAIVGIEGLILVVVFDRRTDEPVS